MPELWHRWRTARRALLVLAAAGVGTSIVIGLGEGRGAPYSLKASAFDVGTVTGPPPPSEATVGKPRFTATPPAPQRRDEKLLPADGVPTVALDAYEAAAGELAATDASCQIDWEDLAGIGRIESDNGQTHGSDARATSDGTLVPPIYGPLLDGSDGFPAIASPDDGVMEGGGSWARAVGPMQFLPSTWVAYAKSDIGDSPPDPQNFYDAALTAGEYLCTNGGDLATPNGLTAAIYAYNHSSSYVQLVEEWVSFYTQVGTSALLAAGAGELPVGELADGSGTGSSTTTTAPGAGAAALSAAASATDAQGTYQFTLEALAGTTPVASGTGGVDYIDHDATVTLDLDGTGTLSLREVAETTYVSLPRPLAVDVGAEGPWVVLSNLVLQRLPNLDERAVGALADDVLYLVAQLAGATGSVQEAGSGFVSGVPSSEYAGVVDLQLAATDVPAARTPLIDAAALLGGADIGVDAWVDDQQLVRSLTLTLPRMPGTPVGSPFSVDLFLSSFGTPLTVKVPPVSPVSPSSTTTTTTRSSSTTTSSSSTTSTSSTSTSTTTTVATTGTTGSTGSTGTGPTGSAGAAEAPRRGR